MSSFVANSCLLDENSLRKRLSGVIELVELKQQPKLTVVNATQFELHFHNSWLKYDGALTPHPSKVTLPFSNSAFQSTSSQTETVAGALMFHILIPTGDSHHHQQVGRLSMVVAFSAHSSGLCSIHGEFTDDMKGVWERLDRGGGSFHLPCCAYTDLGGHKTELGTEVFVNLQLDCKPGREARVTLTQFSHDVCTCTWKEEPCLSYDTSFAMDN